MFKFPNIWILKQYKYINLDRQSTIVFSTLRNG